MSGAADSGSEDISLVGRETLLSGVVCNCVSTGGVAISDRCRADHAVQVVSNYSWRHITVARCRNQCSNVPKHSSEIGSHQVRSRLMCSTHYRP